MSTGAVHILSSNAGSMDRVLNASDLLFKRIVGIRQMRAQQGQCNTAPTLRDIEKSHVLFVNAHFKPFAAVALEYEIVRAQSGTANYDGGVQFSIPQFGDFFTDMAAHIRIAPVECTTVTPATVGPTDVTELVVPPLATSVQLVNSAGVALSAVTPIAVPGVLPTITVTTPFTARNYVKYCDKPGLRLLRNVSFTVNGNPLDEYTSDVSLMYDKFLIPVDKRYGFNILIGQENPQIAYTEQTAVAGQSALPQIGLPASTVTNRRQITILNGPQTPKALQPALDLMIPHWFWFCKDSRLALASVSIPYGQRFINWTIEAQNRIHYTMPSQDVFLEFVVAGVAGPPALPANITRRPVKFVASTLSTGSNNGAITEVRLLINNLFMQNEVHDIYIDRVGFNMIRLHRHQTVRINTSDSQTLMNQLKWPTETLYLGVRPVANVEPATTATAVNWTKFGRVATHGSTVRSTTYSLATSDATLLAGNNKVFSDPDAASYQEVTPVIEQISVEAHGNNLYQRLPLQFYNAYLPFQMGGSNVITPTDPGVAMINWALYPGTYQPSGHINISRSREFYINLFGNANTPLIDAQNPADLKVYAVCINFLLVSDGSAVIRYST